MVFLIRCRVFFAKFFLILDPCLSLVNDLKGEYMGECLSREITSMKLTRAKERQEFEFRRQIVKYMIMNQGRQHIMLLEL